MTRFPKTLALALAATGASAQFRPPAVPLIAHDPYFSVWSFDDRLSDGITRHWTGAEQPLSSLIRIDGKVLRLMGSSPVVPPALPQTGLRVWPTRTVYTFAGEGVEVWLTFTTPILPDDVDVLSRPATYLTWDVRATDGKTHDASVYFSAGAALAVNVPSQEVVWRREKAGAQTLLSIGSEEQPVLAKKGDNLRIDWGHLLVAGQGKAYLGASDRAMARFFRDGGLPADERSKARAADNVVAAFAMPLGKVGASPVSRRLTVAYDDEYSIQFMGHNLRPYWRRPRADGRGMDGKGLIAAADRDFPRLSARCEAFDRELTDDLTRVGGADYANVATLAFRQSFAAQKVVADANGQPLMFGKENFSNGCIATVDVLYPAAPQLLLFSPTLTKASLVPILEYAASARWRWPFAPHDLGTYPKANGQVYGGGERTEDDQMPVEETGNMLILLAALAKEEGNARFSETYWPQLSKWAAYLADKGFDPERQLSTDDFAGHLAHNVNLSAKAIEALGAYATLAETLGKSEEAAKYRTMAKGFSERWVREATEADHTKLAFDRPGTWSQKYNLVWDRLLGLDLFPREVAQREIDFYRTKLNTYGFPLDSRADYTKLDWEVWSATMATRQADFEALVAPIARFLNETPDRVPMTDWGMTSTPRPRGFQARSVVGGVFVKMLGDPAWGKYAMRDRTPVGPWADLPTPPVVTEVAPTSQRGPTAWSYTFAAPPVDWAKAEFDASGWKKGAGGFGHGTPPDAAIRTVWSTEDIWLRREFTLASADVKDLQLMIQHDDDAEVYLNGVLVVRLPNAERFETFDLSKAAKAALKVGRNVIAIHCRDTGGDSYIDAGLVTSRLP